MKKQNGFSLIEVMVALGLMSVVFASSGYQAYQMSLMQKKLTETAENITGTTFAENFLWEKLRTSGVSFNVAVIPDDSGKNFYDFNGDVPESLVPADRRERRLTLSNDPGKPADFFLFTYDFTESPTAIFDPAKAYNLTETSATTASSFTYVGVNANGSLKERMGKGWAPGKTYLMMNPVPLRLPTATGIIDMTTPGKPMVFMGEVTADEKDLSHLNLSFVRKEDPRDPTNLISTADRFFRYLPLAAGSAPLVQIIPVKIIRFWLEPNPAKIGTSTLYYGIFEGGQTTGRFMLADDVKVMVLKRKSITSRLISAQICSKERVEQCLK